VNYNDELNATAQLLEQGTQKVDDSGGTLSSAIAFSETASPPIAVALVAFDNSVNVLHDTDFEFASSYSRGLLESATDHAVVIEGERPYQLRAVHTANDEYVLLATSVLAARASLERNSFILLLTSLLAISFGGGLVVLLARRNMKSVIVSLSNAAEQERETRQSMQTAHTAYRDQGLLGATSQERRSGCQPASSRLRTHRRTGEPHGRDHRQPARTCRGG
jgi:hypothetical protein